MGADFIIYIYLYDQEKFRGQVCCAVNAPGKFPALYPLAFEYNYSFLYHTETTL